MLQTGENPHPQPLSQRERGLRTKLFPPSRPARQTTSNHQSKSQGGLCWNTTFVDIPPSPRLMKNTSDTFVTET